MPSRGPGSQSVSHLAIQNWQNSKYQDSGFQELIGGGFRDWQCDVDIRATGRFREFRDPGGGFRPDGDWGSIPLGAAAGVQ